MPATRADGNGSGNGRHRRPPQQRRPLNFNSARTAWILSLLLAVTLVTQVALIAFHDEVVLELNTWEEQIVQDYREVEAISGAMRSDGLGAAYQEFLDWEAAASEADDVDAPIGEMTHIGDATGGSGVTRRMSNYSMEPLDILRRAGVDHTEGYVPSIGVRDAIAIKKKRGGLNNQKKEAELPSLEEVQSMYGNSSYVLGLDRCQAFRDSVAPEHRLMGPAGIFNSATNLLNRLLKLNCMNNDRMKAKLYRQAPTGMMLQAPWGKHNPASWRLHHEAAVGGKGIKQTDFLPIVMIKDPITWMSSMCRHPYEARWRHVKDHCPNLVPNRYDRGRKPGRGTMQIKVKFATQHIGDEPIPDKDNKTFVSYSSLVDLWNTWYKQWHDVDFPRLMVRFEDLIFHAEDTVSDICHCGGGSMRRKFRYEEGSAKGQTGPHAGSAGFLASLVTYGNSTLRNRGILTDERDLEHARTHLDTNLMDLFGYAHI